MSDPTPNSSTLGNDAAILAELSAIKSSLAVNTSETANIKENIKEMKGDIKEIKSTAPTRMEFDSYRTSTDKILTTHSTEIEILTTTKNRILGAFIVLQFAWGIALFLASKYL